MVLKRISLAGLALATAGFSETLNERMDDAYERVLSKNGIEIKGGIDAEYFHSSLGGNLVDETEFAYETTQFTSFDLDMRYRPYDFLGARAIVRFHQDWQTFFATRSRIVAARWLSMDGNIANMLSFNAGDFRQKYTALTLWAPELDLGYEPEIFSAARGRLMEEQFLGDNNRVLQGLNLNFAKRLRSPLSEIRVDAIGSRINHPEFLDGNGWQGSKWDRVGLLSGTGADMDRFFLAGNGEVLLWDNLVLGGTYEALLDDRDSFQPVAYGEALMTGLPVDSTDNLSLNFRRDVIAQDLRVVAAHGGADLAGFLGNKNLHLEVLGEYAASSEGNRRAWHFRRDAGGALIESDSTLPGTDGKAINLHLGAGWASEGSYGIKLEADWINNEESFRNPLAQSPTFVASRVMNTENDKAGSTLFSTFDALNNGVYKFTPSDTAPGYHLAPFSKTSYRSGILTSQEIGAFIGEPVVQLVLPMGTATPNRTGFQARLSGNWREAIHLYADYAGFKELVGERRGAGRAEPATLTRIGAGTRLELAKLLDWSTALDLSASYSRSETKRPAVATLETVDPRLTANLLQLGVTWRFFRKWGILGGYQQSGLEATTNLNPPDDLATETQRHFRLGLEYALNKRAYFLVSGGLLQVERDPTEFSQTLSQALVKVRF